MFWKFNLLTSHIDTLLEKEDLTLHEILDEDDVLQECRAQNKRLLEFLVRPDNVEELVNYITVEPSDDTDEKLRYKYPNTACELLTSDVNQITEKVAGDENLMNKVYGFLEKEDPLNPLLASFFSKVMGLLITRRSEQMLDFLQSKDDFIGHLLRHLGTSAIMDLLLRLITCIENHECQMKCLNWLNEKQLITRLISMIDPAHSEEKHCNASQSLCDIIRLSREQMSQLQERAEQDPLLASIESQEVITDLLNHMFDGDKSESVLVNGISIIQTLLEFKRVGSFMSYSPDGRSETITPLDAERLAHGVNNTVQALIPRLKDFHQTLKDPPKQHFMPMPTTIGTLNPPFGNTRLQTTKLITTLLVTKTAEVNKELANLGTLGVLLDLCFQYLWNNFLHVQVEQCVATILSAEDENSSGEENPLLRQLLTDFKLVERIQELWDENDQQQTRPGGHRRGYMGHLTKMANHIVSNMEKGSNSERIKDHCQELAPEARENWEAFVTGALAETNKQNTVEMAGGQGGMYSSSEDDDTDFRDIPFPQDTAMQQAFSDYQLQKMTSDFIDQFGFNEGDFAEVDERASEKFKERISSINFDINTDEITNAAALFDQACNDRVQTFDDQESEEDLWEEKEITFSQSSDSRQNSTAEIPPGRGAVPPTGTPEDSDSDDSEEELDSPRRIHQSPTTSSPQQIMADSTTTEKMDIDGGDNWANFDDISMETTTENPTSTSWPSSSTGSAEEPSTSADNWANFGESADLSSTDPGPRSNSPVAMETSEESNSSTRTAAYLVSSAPADLASEVSQASAEGSSSGSPTSSSCTRTIADSSSTSTVTGAVTADTTSTTMSDISASSSSPEAADSSQAATGAGQGSADTSSAVQSADSSASTDEATTVITDPPTENVEPSPSPDTDQGQGHDGDSAMEEDQQELANNFNFLESSNLMKPASDSVSPSSTDSQSTPQGDQSKTDTQTDSNSKLEQIRAQAKEALDQFNTTTNNTSSSESSTTTSSDPATPPSSQNGPV